MLNRGFLSRLQTQENGLHAFFGAGRGVGGRRSGGGGNVGQLRIRVRKGINRMQQ